MKAITRNLLAAMSAVAGLSLFAAPLTASAANTATGTLQAQIVITSDCTVSGGNSKLDFSSHKSTETDASANNGGFSVTCTNLTPYTIGLQSASAGSTTNGAGVMSSTAPGVSQTIGYQLYQDSSYSTAWGNSTSGTANVKSATGTGAAQAYVVYGKTTSTLNVPAATYSDTVNINVYY
ncbi:spore coat U domain-containing protein [Candidimonas humi]|uniref:Spore coat U domain-containing protein n=1 Tax=Candidimonas humi TaxID=683355 RepID=A0ABV8NW04_9BURK|nr:spore coat U domain-containing protein [Candidimonas humi]MBV6306002.1 spore coat U domain-containing protein [Candidimonas humi]